MAEGVALLATPGLPVFANITLDDIFRSVLHVSASRQADINKDE